VIDLRDDESRESPAGLFAPRRATVFSISTEAEPVEYAFGRHRVRR
jgi:hypothetical protein